MNDYCKCLKKHSVKQNIGKDVFYVCSKNLGGCGCEIKSLYLGKDLEFTINGETHKYKVIEETVEYFRVSDLNPLKELMGNIEPPKSISPDLLDEKMENPKWLDNYTIDHTIEVLRPPENIEISDHAVDALRYTLSQINRNWTKK